MKKRHLKQFTRKHFYPLVGGISVVILAILFVAIPFLQKTHQKYQKTQEITQFIKTTKPLVKSIKNAQRATIAQKGYSLTVAKQSNATDPVNFSTKNGSIAFASFSNPTLGSLNATNAVLKDGKTVYPNIYNGVDLIYTNSPTMLLEEYEVKTPRPLTQFIQKIDLSSVSYKEQADGSILFFNKASGEFAFAVPRPVMYEAADTMHRSYGLHYEIVTVNGATYLVKVIDDKGQQWLKQASYPVMVDATVTLTLSAYQTYPVLNGQFQVRIDTVGAGDLGITAISKGLSFVSLSCGNSPVSMNNQLISQNFSCSDETVATFKVTDSGQQSFAFTYSGQTTTVTTQGATGKPVFLSASVDKPVVKLGDTITVSAQIADDAPLSSVAANMGGIDTISLQRTSGTANNGTYQGSWIVHNTGTKTYPVTFTATDTNNQSTSNSVAFFDPYTCTGGGDHAGANWDPATDCPSGFAGTHTNIGTLSVALGETATVLAFDNVATGGFATASATTVTIAGTMTADGKGWKNGAGPGAGTYTGFGSGGGAYGGTGGSGSNGVGGAVYGNALTPSSLGSSGGTNGASTTVNGGGYIKLTATGTLTVSGTVTANGLTDGNCQEFGGGSGGSILLTGGTLAGAGTMSANGGNGSSCSNHNGNGGGGRVALSYSTSNTMTTYPTATAGTNSTGTNGTVVVVDSTNNDLYIDQSQTWNSNPSLEGSSFTYHNVTVQNNATWTLNGYNTTNTNGVGFSFTTSNFNVTTGSTVNMNGTGYAGGTGTASGAGSGGGAGTAGQTGGGGGYGGAGGTGGNGSAGGAVYGTFNGPVDLGSGGGAANGSAGGTGGGAIKITATGTVTVAGTITANGANGNAGGSNNAGGGSGGSIWIATGTFAGAGTITANGGTGGTNCCSGNGGKGSGGRIYISYSASNTFSGTSPAVSAGSSGNGGNTGTSLLVDTTNNDLYINTSQTWSAKSSLEGAVPSYHNITVQNNSTWTLNGYNTTNSDGVGFAFNVTNNFNLTTGSTINMNSTGYAGGTGSGSGSGPGAGTGTAGSEAGGAGYGGAGGASSTGIAGGAAYGSAVGPVDLGSGGGSSAGNAGGAGGGAIKIVATGTVTIAGSMTANGGNGASGGSNNSGGGSGGGIWIATGTFTGAGTITASGGSGGTNCCGGSGGKGAGGRISIYYATANNWTGNTLTAASAAPAGTSGNGGANGTVTVSLEHTPVISSFNQFQSDCTTAVATGGFVTNTSGCIGTTITDTDNPDTEKIELELQPNGTAFTNTATYTISNVAMAGSAVSKTQAISGLSFGTSYHWQARITDSFGFTTGWTAAGGNPDFTVQVPAPLTATATYNSDTSITLNWTITANVVDGFDVERSTDGGAYTVLNSNVAYPTTTYTDSTPVANHQYTYRVREFLGTNNSAYTTASAVYTTPAAPSAIVLTQPHVGTILVSWTDNSGYESNFEVQRQIASGSWVSLSTTIAANATSFSDTNVQQNAVYNYRVRSTRTSPNSLQSLFGTSGVGFTPSGFGKGIYLTAAGKLVVGNSVAGSVDEFKNIQNDTTNKIGADVVYDTTHPASGPVFPTTPTINDLTVQEGVSEVDGKSDVIYVATNNGLFAIHENATTPSKGAIKVYTKDYISELMIGDTRGMWPLDTGYGSGLSDASSHAQTLTNNATTTFSASGVRGNAATFNGTTQYLSIADNTNLSVTGNITFGAWFKTTATNSAQTILAKNGSYVLSLTNTGTVQAQIIGATTATRAGATTLDTGWHHAVVVYSASGQTLDVYVDGKLNDGSLTGTVPAAITDSTGDFEIGGNNATTLFSGNIDEAFVSATAYTAGQIGFMYQNGYRALQNHTASRITGVTGADTYQQLLGGGTAGATVNSVKAVRVDGVNQFIYEGTNDNSANTGGVSVIGVGSDSVADLYSTINTSKTDSLGNAFSGNDTVAIGLSGTPNPAYNGQQDVSATPGTVVIVGTNDIATRVWMEQQRYSLSQVLGASTGIGGNQNAVNVNNLLTVGNALAPSASTSGAQQLIAAFQVNQQGNITQNYNGTDTTGTVMSFNDTISTSGATFALTGSALTTGTLINATANSLTTGTGLNLTSSSTSFTGNLANLSTAGNGKVLNLTSTSSVAGTNYGLYASLTGAATTNVAGYFSATGATNNYGLVVANGNVGFGTTSPTALLDIAGNASTSGSLTFRGATAKLNALNGDGLNFQTSVNGDAGLASRMYIANNGNVGIGTINPAALFDVNSFLDVLSTGTVGIGTTAPLGMLDIRSSLGGQPIASLSGKTSLAGLIVDNSGVGDLFAASTSGTTRFVVTNNGSVGIGNAAPTRSLDIAGNVVHSTAGLTSQLSLRGTANTTNKLNIGYDTTSNYGFIEAVNENTAWQNLLLQPSGGNVAVGANLAIGQTSTFNASLDFGAIAATNKLYLFDSGTAKYGFGANAGMLQLYTGGDSINNAVTFNRYDGTTLTEMARVQNGTFVVGSSSFLAAAGIDVEKNALGNAAVVINQTGTGDLLTASSSGTAKFTVSNSGNVTANGNMTINGNLNTTGYATASASLAVGYSSVNGGVGNAVFSGQVGIGTNTPTQALSVAGDESIFDSTINRGDIYSTVNLNKTWNTTALFNTAGATFSAGMTNPAVNNQLSLLPNLPLTGWAYRKAITVNNTGNTNTLTNYQVQITADTATPIAAGKMNSNCSDLRITDSNGSTTLNYWIESGCNTASTIIWAKIPSVTASSNYTIYLYYGNPSAASQSSVATTFIRDVTTVSLAYRFDEASGTTTTDYSGNANTGTYTGTTVVAGQFGNSRNFTTTSDITTTAAPVTLGLAWTESAWINFPLPVTSGGYRSVFVKTGGNYHSLLVDSGGNLGTYNNAWAGSGYNVNALSGWHQVTEVGNGGTSSFYIDGAVVGTASAEIQNQSVGTVGNFSGGGQNIGKLDEPRIYSTALTQAQITDLAANYGYVTPNYAGHELVRKYSSPEPTTSVGAEAASYTTGLQSWYSDTTDAGAGNTYRPNSITVNYTLDGTDNIAPKFQIEGSNTGAFTGEQTIYPAGNATYYQSGGTYPITNGTLQDVSSQVTSSFRYWKVVAYMDTGATSTDTPTITSIKLQDNRSNISLFANGNVGIGNTNAAFRLDVSDAQSATVAAMIRNNNAGTTASGLGISLGSTNPGTGNYFLSFLDGAGRIIGKIQGNGAGGVTYATSGIDFAEYFKKANASESLQPGTVVCQDTTGITTCSTTTTGKMVGVISDRAGFTGGSEHAGDNNYALVGLIGQLPVTISTASGTILPGDQLTTDSSGNAVKQTTSGQSIGTALEGSDQATDGKIMVHVNVSWYDPTFYSQATTGVLGASTTTIPQDVPLLTAQNATISGTLSVLGRTVVTDLGVTGKITSGLMAIDGLNGAIDVVGQPLKLQANQTAGIDILSGKITISAAGDMQIQGSLTAGQVSTDKLNVTASSATTGVLSASAGTTTIQAGQTSVSVQTTKLTSNSLIFVTPDSPVAIGAKKTSNTGFVITLSQPATQTLHINWWIVN
ncbi:MAG TPA: DUF2341 domain-containing protein [Patescibacteria group bacterium]|nr:DUF2341 domain-containing protein [Patescibacteria group bacterium]